MPFIPVFFRPKHGTEGGGEEVRPEESAGQESEAEESRKLTLEAALGVTPPSAGSGPVLDPPGSGKLALLLDDVLARVPTRALRPGLHDPSRELLFDMEELREGISRGRATISLSRLAERYPDTFEPPASEAEETAITLPLQKLIDQMSRAARRNAAGGFLAPSGKGEDQGPQSHETPEPVRTVGVVAPVWSGSDAGGTLEEPRETAATETSSVIKGEKVSEAVPNQPEPPSAQVATPVPSDPPVKGDEARTPILAPVEPQAPCPMQSGVPESPQSRGGEVRIHQISTPPPLPIPAKEPAVNVVSPTLAAASVAQASPAAEPKPAPASEPASLPLPIFQGIQHPMMRIPFGRPMIRPPSIHGPSGIVVPGDGPAATPPVPGLIFAPRPAHAPAASPEPAPEREQAKSEVVIPPLFSQPTPSEVSSRGSSDVVTPPSPIPSQEPQQPPAADPESVIEEKAEVHANGFDPMVSPESSSPPEAAGEAEPVQSATEGAEGSAKTEEPEQARLEEEDDNDAHFERVPERQIARTPRKDSDLFGTHFSLARIDQEPLQAIFMTEEFLDLPRVSQLSCGFPGVSGCLIVAGDALGHGGDRPAGLDGPALCRLTRQLSATAAEFPEELPAVQTFTLHAGNRALSIFARQHVSMCVVHSHRGFLPGVRERLAAVADTLSRGLSDEPEPAE